MTPKQKDIVAFLIVANWPDFGQNIWHGYVGEDEMDARGAWHAYMDGNGAILEAEPVCILKIERNDAGHVHVTQIPWTA